MDNLRHSLELGLICPVYLFYGEETLLMEQMIERIAKLTLPPDDQWGREIYYGDETDMDALILSAQSTGMFAPKKLIELRNAPWFKRRKGGAADATEQQKAQLDMLIAYIEDPNPDTVLIITASQTDRGSRLHKAIAKAGRAVEFTTPRGMEKESWLNAYFKRAGKQPARGVSGYICLVCGEGLTALKAEADKLLLYTAGRTAITMEDAEAVVSKGALAGIFELTDAAAAQNGAEAAAIYRRLLRQGETAPGILALLAAQYRNILGMKDLRDHGFSVSESAAKLGIAPFVARKCAGVAGNYSYRQLLQALEILLNADIAGKSGGGAMPQLLETAILRICAMGRN